MNVNESLNDRFSYKRLGKACILEVNDKTYRYSDIMLLVNEFGV